MRVNKIEQSSIPNDNSNIADGVGFSTGISVDSNDAYKATKKKRKNKISFGYHKFTSSTADISTVASSVVGASKARNYLLIQNIGTETIFLGFNVTPKINGENSIELPAGFQISFENGIVPNTAINALSVVGSRISVLEGVGA
ncbi:MAG: hypothetical protein COB41_05550 [Proteobacteria bacterium]|nr:MAG: hypothetical protein COB41_05550 [Pseudomonadota bacterium]